MARQKEDKVTMNLLRSQVAARQSKFKANQRAKGLKQMALWVTPEQEEKIKVMLKGGTL